MKTNPTKSLANPKTAPPAPPQPVSAPGYGRELKTVTARMSQTDCARVDAVALAIHKQHFGWGEPNRSTAFRTILVAGLEALEPRYGIKTPKVTK